ncbi:ComF family protein [Neptunomonas sp.]|uniref:ComF family protein n=1 Tax=Neptunomonas sp. TaxID=1971898 RepID=UPI0025EB1335|nr:ComF family protein [Neptunomonas sp.]
MFSLIKNICTKIDQNCALCHSKASSELALCKNCYNDLPWLTSACHICALPLIPTNTPRICGQCLKSPPTYSSTQAVFLYRFPINAIIPKIKHHHGLHHTSWLASCLLNRLLKQPQAWPDAIIPVPIHSFRLISRGFNQSSLIARHLSQHLKIPLVLNHLKKIKRTKSQSTLSAQDRKTNLQNAFSYQGPSYNHIALVDDVVTTGTTVKEISDVLRLAGIQRIDIWVIARTPAPD